MEKLTALLTDDRNRTVHTYHEEVATAIFARLPDYSTLMNSLVRGIAGEE